MNKYSSFNKFIQDLADILSPEEKPKEPIEVDILTASKLSQLKWLSATQLASIYKYGKVKTKIDDDPEAYAQLKWFNSNQLKAMFGDDL